jgi:hypothetical protein
MLGLPLEVYNHMREFVLPIPYNWRTRRAHEAELIRDEFIWRRDTYVYRRLRNHQEADEVRSWSLYGIMILDRLYIGGRSPLIPPSEAAYQDNPKAWYRHRLQWVSEGGE